jgi:hypothetical protein
VITHRKGTMEASDRFVWYYNAGKRDFYTCVSRFIRKPDGEKYKMSEMEKGFFRQVIQSDF